MEKKKMSKKKKIIIIVVIAAVVLIVGGFCAFRFFGRGPQPPQAPSQQEAQDMAPPGSGQYFETGPNGETAPAPPTRPPQS